MRREILEAMARTLTVTACADAYDEGFNDIPQDQYAGPGTDWFDTIRDGYPPEALWYAKAIFQGTRWNVEAEAKCWTAITGRTVEDFAHYFAMASLGHGVGLEDAVPCDSSYRPPQVGHFDFGPYCFDVVGWLQGANK